MRRARFPGVVVLLLAVVLLLTATRGWTQAKPPVSVALVAAMSGGSALSGEAIKRGLTVEGRDGGAGRDRARGGRGRVRRPPLAGRARDAARVSRAQGPLRRHVGGRDR